MPRGVGVAAAVLWAGYALPLFFPPISTTCGAAVPAEAGLWARMFPDVPAWWTAARLCCLAAASVAVGLATRGRLTARRPVEPHAAPLLPRTAIRIALVLSGVQVLASLWANRFGRAEQLVYIAVLGLPALILFWASRGRTGRRRGSASRAAVLIVSAAWLVLRLPGAWHSPRTASAVDALGAFTYLEQTASPGFNLLTDGPWKGVSSIFLVSQGAGLFGLGLPLTLPVLQLCNAFWMALLAVGIGRLSARLVAPSAAPVAAAAFLFSPFSLLAPVAPIALFHGAMLATGLLLLLLAIHQHRSPPAAAAFGALAGVGVGHPLTLPITLALSAAALWSARRRPRLPAVYGLIAMLSFAAAVVPALPSLADLQAMRESYAFGRKAWRPLEHLLLGQGSPLAQPQLMDAGRVGPFDIPFGAALSPFAIPRTPARLWGDALYDPLGTGLAAAGIAACALALRRSQVARGLLFLLAIGVLPASVSSTDRPSLTRTGITPVALALLAGLGFELVRGRFAPAWAAGKTAIAVSVGIAVGGIVLFDVVNPRILPASAAAITLEALGTRPPSGAIVALDHEEVALHWVRTGQAMTTIPAFPVRVVRYGTASSLAEADAGGPPRLVVWSPGLQEQHQVSDAVCARWRAARIYTLEDRTGCSRAFVALVADSEWRPALPPGRWSVRPCGS